MFNLFKLKPIVIALLLLLLFIPIQMISGLIDERQQLSQQVHQDIANSTSQAQRLTGPMLVIETEHYQAENLLNQQVVKAYSQTHIFLPNQFDLQSKLTSETRQRGIYGSRIYHSQNTLSAQFKLPTQLSFEMQPELSPAAAVGNIRLKSARLVIGLTDVRGLIGMPKLTLDGQELTIQPGTGLDALSGLQASVDLTSILAKPQFDLRIEMAISGSQYLSVTPVGDHSQWQLSADWPHPGFSGRFLPLAHQIDEQGFTANWQSSQFSNDVKNVLAKCVLQGNLCDEFTEQRFLVNLIDPVDHYLQSTRAIKYALLVLVVTFAVFYLFEILGQLLIHPMQYLFIGLALAMFYLLLISLSEVLGFAFAYLLATIACVGLCGFYTMAVLKSKGKGLAFTLGLTLLYALLFMILQAEDMALLAGTLLLFSVLSAVMISTRHLNWFQLHAESTLTSENAELLNQAKTSPEKRSD